MNAKSQRPGELSVRLVTPQDYDQWLPLWDGYNAFYGRAGATALSTEITRMTWARFFDAYEPVHGLVAESGGRLLSLCRIPPQPPSGPVDKSCCHCCVTKLD
jgi:hypothetical protein